MLKFGMIGGGLGSYIGKFHRWGAMLDDCRRAGLRLLLPQHG